MGCDGGTIPTRDEMVRLKKKPEQKDKDSEIAHKWQNCALSQEALRSPIVACELGRLYNKEAILEMLLDRSTFECASSFAHIRTLKDIKELRLSENPAYKNESHQGNAYCDKHDAQYICPISGLTMNGRFRFSYLLGCGCVVSERAVKEAKSDVCLKCGASFKHEDVIVLNGTDEDQEKMATNMQQRRQRAKLEKKTKKAIKKPAEETVSSGDGVSESKKVKLDTSSNRGKKMIKNGSSKLGTATSTVTSAATSTSTIQDNPNASKIYKALFTSHPAAKNRPTAHWVTYNPQYF